MELPDNGVVPVGGEEHGRQGLGADGGMLLVAGRIGATFHEQADHLELLVHDRPLMATRTSLPCMAGGPRVIKVPPFLTCPQPPLASITDPRSAMKMT